MKRKPFKARLCLSLALSMLLSTMFAVNTFAINSMEEEKPYWDDSPVQSNNIIDDPQLEAVTRKEEYIVSLINELNKDTQFVTTLLDWEYNLAFLKDNYDLITKTSSVIMEYVNSYIEAYEFVLLDKNTPKTMNRDRCSLPMIGLPPVRML